MKIPKPTECHEPLQRLYEKQHELQIVRNDKKSEAAILRTRINDNQTAFGNAADNRVREILGEPVLPTVSPDIERLDVVLKELHDINAALAILDSKIQIEKGIASRIICDEVRPEVTPKGKTFAKALVALYAAHADYENTLDAIENSGVNITSLGRVWPNALGGVRDRSGAYHYAFREFVDANLLAKSEVPECVR